FPRGMPRLLVSHTRPEPMLGLLRRLDDNHSRLQGLGYINHGGTLDTNGMLFANRCSWAHIVAAAARACGAEPADFLDPDELAAVNAQGDPAVLWGSGAPQCTLEINPPPSA